VFSVLCISITIYLYIYCYRRETARQLRMYAQLTRCFSAVAELLVNLLFSHESCYEICFTYFYSSCAMFLTHRKRSTWHQCKKHEYSRPMTNRPCTFHTFWKISNGHDSAMRPPIHFVFGSRMGFWHGRLNGAILGLLKSKMAADGNFEKIQTAISLQRVIRWLLTHMTGDWTLISQGQGNWPTYDIKRENGTADLEK